jgi:signal transduction histidine kinase
VPDLLLSIAVALVIAIAITADQGGRQDPDAIAYLFACTFGALMLLRRRFPVAVLVVTMFLLSAYYILDYPAIGLAVPVAAALYSAAEFGHLKAAIIVSFFLIVTSTYFRIMDGETIAYLLGYELISTVTLMAAAIALGDSTRARRALRTEQEETARLIAQEHAHRAEQRIQEERMRMARDLHDIIGHSISVISLHSDVAREALGHDDNAARQALAHVRAATSETMQELRRTVKLLRGSAPEQPNRPLTSLQSLSTLVEHARESGLQVDVHTEGELTGLPATVDSAAYRIIQESLTNVMRHASATRVTVSIRANTETVDLRIADNGAAAASPGPLRAGSGIAGMQERARLLGGELTAGPRPAGGFEVQATLLLGETA